MTAPRRCNPRRTVRRLTAALVPVTAAVLLGTAPAALAHDGLVSTSPAAEATVETGPAAVELDFSGEPLPLGTLVEVGGPDGPVTDGPPGISGTRVVQPLAEDLPPGAYRVEWRSTSSDGHALTGTFDFTVSAGGGPAAAASSSGATGPGPTSSGSTSPDSSAAVMWPVAGAVAVVGLGAVLLTRLRRRV